MVRSVEKRSIWAPPGRSALGKCERVLVRGPRKMEEDPRSQSLKAMI